MLHFLYVKCLVPISRSVASTTRCINHGFSNIPMEYDIKGIVEVGEDGIPLANDQVTDSINQTTVSSFTDLGVTRRLSNSLSNTAGILVPNSIQKLALPRTLIRGGRSVGAGSCIIQSETGSGKTLTYLLPALQDTRPGLTSIVVTPSRELAVQVCYWARKLTGNSKTSRRIGLLVSGKTEESLVNEYEMTKPHILIGTPKILHDVLIKNEGCTDEDKWELFLKRVVLDEADVLLEPLNPKATWKMKRNRLTHPKPTRILLEAILGKVHMRGRGLQLICTSATIPTALQQELVDIGWAGPPEVINTNTVTKQVPQEIDHTHIMCGHTSDEPHPHKLSEIVRHFRDNGLKSALVFVHRDVSVMKCVNELREMGVASEAIYTHLDSPIKLNNVLSKFENGEIQLMVGNEETVRGLDFPFLDTVYLTEVPRNATEYLHLSGRVGRCGLKGRVIVMIETTQEMSRMRRLYTQLNLTTAEGGECD